jgi:hypothetical protein
MKNQSTNKMPQATYNGDVMGGSTVWGKAWGFLFKDTVWGKAWGFLFKEGDAIGSAGC